MIRGVREPRFDFTSVEVFNACVLAVPNTVG